MASNEVYARSTALPLSSTGLLALLTISSPTGSSTLGSSFLVFPQSLDIIFVYLTMYLIDALIRGRFLPIPEMVECP